MEFREFKEVFLEHAYDMMGGQNTLFTTNLNPDLLWELYLDSFPPGTNEVFRERREFDCSCCRNFIRHYGHIVVIKDNKTISLWDFTVDDTTYQPVVSALAEYVKGFPIHDVFITKESKLGTAHNRELLDNGMIQTWNHLSLELPPRLVCKSSETIGTTVSQFRATHDVFKRSLQEITKDSIETVLDLITQGSLYKGDEWKSVLSKFLVLYTNYYKLRRQEKHLFCWDKSTSVGGAIGRIRNHSIGVLLTDLSQGTDINDAVKRYEHIVAPPNYKRPKDIFTKKMVEQAQETFISLGLTESLGRRFATIDDITINNILFANRDAVSRMTKDVFSELQSEVTLDTKKFDRVGEVHIGVFLKDILPRITSMEVLVENKHTSNFVSLIAPQNPQSKSLFKWDNGFSWAYPGNLTDSMKQHVKSFGGNINGVKRYSIMWNKKGENQNDFDAHCIEPNGNRIHFPLAKIVQPSSGMLDVDIITPGPNVAVENIVWTDINKMQEGVYQFLVHNYTHCGGRTGFSAEIEYDGQIFSYEYNHTLRHKEFVLVARAAFKKDTGITFIEALPYDTQSQDAWGLKTNQFHQVSLCMFSPNYWDGQKGIGHKHYFFMLDGCKNPEQPNGFFNEFLKEDFMKHKRVFAALGSKMRVEPSENQLSGLGFSSTKRNSLILRVKGHIARTIKVMF